MGRELKRVPLDFAHPVGETWGGYLNPHYVECSRCKAGYSAAYDVVAEHVNGLMWSRAVASNKDVAAITTFLAGREPRSPFGHDSMDAYAAIKKLGELAGLPETWCTCPICKGDGVDPKHAEAYNTWERTDPPTGDGYQIWETVSEGSPISPVFATPEELARHMAGTRVGADHGTSYETWLAFINGPGWAPSMIGTAGNLQDGVTGIVALSAEAPQ